MSDVPKHDHPGAFLFLGLSLLGLILFTAWSIHSAVPQRYELRCSAYVTPPKGCTP